MIPKLTVDDVEIEVSRGAAVLQACELAGMAIPRFCHDERFGAGEPPRQGAQRWA